MASQPPLGPEQAPELHERSSGPAPAPAVDGLIALVLLLLGLGVSLHGLTLGLDVGKRAMPGVAPLAFGLFLALPSAVLLVKSVRARRDSPKDARWDRSERWMSARILSLPVVALAGLAVYVALMKPVGYLVATFLFAYATLWVLKWRGLKGLAGAIGVTAAVYALFSIGLSVPLPSGLLG